jgi:hypothetical protein
MVSPPPEEHLQVIGADDVRHETAFRGKLLGVVSPSALTVNTGFAPSRSPPSLHSTPDTA